MLWHGRPYGCGLKLPEDKKATICGVEGENVVAYGHLPSPANKRTLSPLLNSKCNLLSDQNSAPSSHGYSEFQPRPFIVILNFSPVLSSLF